MSRDEDVQWGTHNGTGTPTKGEPETYDRLLNRLFVGLPRPFTLRLLKDYLHPSFIDPVIRVIAIFLTPPFIYVYMYMYIYIYTGISEQDSILSLVEEEKEEGGDPFNKLSELQKRNQILSRREGARKVASQSTYTKLLSTRNLHRLLPLPPPTSIVATNCLFRESLGAIKRGFLARMTIWTRFVS